MRATSADDSVTDSRSQSLVAFRRGSRTSPGTIRHSADVTAKIDCAACQTPYVCGPKVRAITRVATSVTPIWAIRSSTTTLELVSVLTTPVR